MHEREPTQEPTPEPDQPVDVGPQPAPPELVDDESRLPGNQIPARLRTGRLPALPPEPGPDAYTQTFAGSERDPEAEQRIRALLARSREQARAHEVIPDELAIWVASLLDYTSGRLYGWWLDAAREADEVEADVRAMLALSPTALQTGEIAEDWGIFDHDGFEPLRIGEQAGLSWVSAVARGIAEHGAAFAAWADVMEDEALLDSFAENYLGHYDTLAAYAAQWLEDTGYQHHLDQAIAELPDWLRPHVRIDTDALGQELETGGDVQVYPSPDGGLWLFQEPA